MTDDAELAEIRKRKLAALQAEAAADAQPDADAAPAPRDGPEWPRGVEALTDASFDARVTEFPLALVDFWAPWCGPCRVLSPTIEALADELHGQIAFFKVNVDENPHVAGRYRVQSIPTMLVLRNGVVVDTAVGALPKPQIKQLLEKQQGQRRRGRAGPRVRRL